MTPEPAPPAMSAAPDGVAGSAHAAAPHLAAASPALPDPIGITPPPGARVSLEPEGLSSQQASLDTTMPRPGMGGDPDWLTERLARDAAMHSRSEWTGRWSRRLGAWGAAGVLMALLAGGGFWLYQQSEVEGALVVVANTNPTPSATLATPARPGLVRSTPELPANAGLAVVGKPDAAALPVTPATSGMPAPATPATTATTAPATPVTPAATATTAPPTPAPTVPVATPGATPSAATRNATGVDAMGGSAGPSTAAAAGEPSAASITAAGTRPGAQQTPAPASSIDGANRTVVSVPAADERAVSPPKRPRSHARKRAKERAKVEARAAEPGREPSARQRREETLMQCRAHGYDERQCLQRGCEMTRFGFACKG
jgi:hypothetical protein